MNNDQSRIEELKKKLNSISGDVHSLHRSHLRPHAHQVETHWNDGSESAHSPVTEMKSAYGNGSDGSLLKKILGFSLLALILAGVFAWYMFATGGNYVSANNIDIKVIGPVAIPAGDVLTLDLDVRNGNPEKIETVDIIVEYPEGTRSPEDGSTTLQNDRLPIGDIPKGETVRRKIQVVLFGEENLKKDIKVIVEYKVPGSVILFRKEKIYPIYIGSAPVSIDITNFKEVTPNESTTFKVIVSSNSQSVIKNLLFKAEYPAGFVLEKAVPAPSSQSDTWSLGDMAPGDKREIEITGKIIGEANIERYFGFVTGTQDPLDVSRIAIRLVESKERVLVQKPFLSADITVNQSGVQVPVFDAGTPIQAEIVWQNNLNVPIYDLVLDVELAGNSIDKKTVEAEQGFYTSQNNIITWDGSLVDEFKEIAPGQSGVLQFQLASLPPTLANNTKLRRQSIALNVTVKAKRLGEDRVPQEIQSTASKSIKIASALALSSKIVHSIGPFENTGSIPPIAEKATTYTIMNSVSNSFNTAKDVTYTAQLPSYVTWTGKYMPQNAKVNYNADKREITWSLGDMAPGIGYGITPREFLYQVSVTPSVSQIGQSPVVISSQRVAGTDTFAETVISYTAPQLSTNIIEDPLYRIGLGKVSE